jgi:hypothetical protein
MVIAVALVGAILLGGGLAYTYKILLLISRPAVIKAELQDRIKILTNTLNESARAIEDIEKEIGQRTNLVERLKRDADTAERLAAVNREQAEAIAQTLKGELDRQERANLLEQPHFGPVLYTSRYRHDRSISFFQEMALVETATPTAHKATPPLVATVATRKRAPNWDDHC